MKWILIVMIVMTGATEPAVEVIPKQFDSLPDCTMSIATGILAAQRGRAPGESLVPIAAASWMCVREDQVPPDALKK